MTVLYLSGSERRCGVVVPGLCLLSANYQTQNVSRKIASIPESIIGYRQQVPAGGELFIRTRPCNWIKNAS